MNQKDKQKVVYGNKVEGPRMRNTRGTEIKQVTAKRERSLLEF